MFAFAITVHEIFTEAKLPYWEKKNQEVLEFVKVGNRMIISEKIPKEIQDLILQCWDQDPEKRPNFVAISKMVTQVYEAIN